MCRVMLFVWLCTFFCYCLLQEKGDIDRAIQCYEHAIQVSVLSDDKPGGKMCVN